MGSPMDDRLQKGKILKQARETKGISLEIVHEATKVPLDALKAIEEGYTIRSMSPFYYRGFLKIYSRYLGVDIGGVTNPSVVVEKKESPVPSYFSRKKEEVLLKKIKFTITPEMKQWFLRIVIALVALLIIVKIGQAFGHWRVQRAQSADLRKQKVRDQKIDSKSKKTLRVEKIKESVEGSAPVRQPLMIPRVEPRQEERRAEEPAKEAVIVHDLKSRESQKKIELTVRARKDSWLQVKADNEIIFRSTLRKGAVETWNANSSIEITGKNLTELDFELNGKTMGPISKSNRRAKKILIDQNGFSVK